MPGRTEHGRNSAARSPGRGTARVPVLPLDLADLALHLVVVVAMVDLDLRGKGVRAVLVRLVRHHREMAGPVVAARQGSHGSLRETMRDPFDRMLVAAARAAGTSLITGDTAIRDSALVEIVWD